MDRVLPHVATRQWVVTVLWEPRWLLARRPELASGVHAVALRTIERWRATQHRPPPATLGVSVALTEDGGLTWTERTEDAPPLHPPAIMNETFSISADEYPARGIFRAE